MKELNTPTAKFGAYVNRRSFLAATGLLALATPGAVADPEKKLPGLMRGSQLIGRGSSTSGWWHARNGLVLLAEGVLPLDYVLPPPPVPGDISLEARLRVSFPSGTAKNLLAFQIFLVPTGVAGVPWPVVPPLVPANENDPVTISYSEARIDDIQFATSPVVGTEAKLPTFTISGEILSNEVPSPFGNLTGAACIVTAGFDIRNASGETDFIMLGVAVPGNHTSIAPECQGTLLMKR
jgi:hypothetical protein